MLVRLLELQDGLFVVPLLVFKGLNVLIALLHLILAELNLLLQLGDQLLLRLEVFILLVLGVLEGLEVRLHFRDCLVLVFQLVHEALLFQGVLVDRLFLGEPGRIQAFISISKILDLASDDL